MALLCGQAAARPPTIALSRLASRPAVGAAASTRPLVAIMALTAGAAAAAAATTAVVVERWTVVLDSWAPPAAAAPPGYLLLSRRWCTPQGPRAAPLASMAATGASFFRVPYPVALRERSALYAPLARSAFSVQRAHGRATPSAQKGPMLAALRHALFARPGDSTLTRMARPLLRAYPVQRERAVVQAQNNVARQVRGPCLVAETAMAAARQATRATAPVLTPPVVFALREVSPPP
jgi:hypothetical protein